MVNHPSDFIGHHHLEDVIPFSIFPRAICVDEEACDKSFYISFVSRVTLNKRPVCFLRQLQCSKQFRFQNDFFSFLQLFHLCENWLGDHSIILAYLIIHCSLYKENWLPTWTPLWTLGEKNFFSKKSGHKLNSILNPGQTQYYFYLGQPYSTGSNGLRIHMTSRVTL